MLSFPEGLHLYSFKAGVSHFFCQRLHYTKTLQGIMLWAILKQAIYKPHSKIDGNTLLHFFVLFSHIFFSLISVLSQTTGSREGTNSSYQESEQFYFIGFLELNQDLNATLEPHVIHSCVNKCISKI